MLLFCPLCGGLLLINNQPVSSSPASSSNSFSCKSCAYIFPIESKNYSARVELTRKKVDDVLGGEDAWKNVDSTDGNLMDRSVLSFLIYIYFIFIFFTLFIRTLSYTYILTYLPSFTLQSHLPQVREQSRLLYANPNQISRRTLLHLL